jgi:hypothetical protein
MALTGKLSKTQIARVGKALSGIQVFYADAQDWRI